MPELLASRGELEELCAFALGQDGVAGVAIISFDNSVAILGRVPAVMTTEAPGPISVANIVRITVPIRLHPGKEVIVVILLNERNGLANARIIRIPAVQERGDAIVSLRFITVRASQGKNRVGLDVGQFAVQVPERDGQIDLIAG